MRTKWVLIGYGILYLAVALSFLPLERVVSPQIEDVWEIFPGALFGLMTVISIGLLEGMTLLAGPLARGIGMRQMYAEEGLLALICIGVAVFSAARLMRKDLPPGRQGTYTFFLLLALSVIAMVRFTMHSWAHFA
jgi:hypothetical protein